MAAKAAVERVAAVPAAERAAVERAAVAAAMENRRARTRESLQG